ncbi:HDOD domain-containing protein [Aurantivibrio plasticivorans]
MHQELTQDQIQSILQGVSIPPQPQILVDLQMEQVSPDCSIEKITQLIAQDVGLSGSILKTVNSNFFGNANNITSIGQAANLLGVNSVVNLVNANSIKGELSDSQIQDLGRFWDSAMEVAMAAAAIARSIGYPNADEAYTLGLFHNCAVPLLMSRFDNYDEVINLAYGASDQSITDVENSLLKTNHAVVGYYVGKSWHLPEYLCEAIHEHHRAELSFAEPILDPKKSTLLAILKMAEHSCKIHQLLGCQQRDFEWERIQGSVLNYVGLSEPDFIHLQESIWELGLGTGAYYG